MRTQIAALVTCLATTGCDVRPPPPPPPPFTPHQSGAVDGGALDAGAAAERPTQPDAEPQRVDDAGVDGATGNVVSIQSAGECAGGELDGPLISSVCIGPAELARFGCMAAAVNDGESLRTIATEDEMRAAEYSITYSDPGGVVVYLCTGERPDQSPAGCFNVLLGGCSDVADQTSCGRLYLLSPMPSYSFACF